MRGHLSARRAVMPCDGAAMWDFPRHPGYGDMETLRWHVGWFRLRGSERDWRS